jgi:thioredoxin-related protein
MERVKIARVVDINKSLSLGILCLFMLAMLAYGQASSPVNYIPASKYDPNRNAAQDIRDAISEAQRSGRRILLEVGGEWCGWCHTLDQFFAERSELMRLRDQNFVTVKINFSHENENQELLSQYPTIPGFPHIFVLSSDGKLLHSQNTSELESGKSYNLERLTTLLTTWAPAKTQPAAAQSPTATPSANPADVATIDSIIAALYDVISGPPGKRDWDRFRSLFISGARLIPTGVRQTGEAGSRVLTPDEYIQRSAPFLEKEGFFEREVSRRAEKFANIAHIFSTYESRHAKDDAKPFARGINSIQLMNDGKRWWIVTVFWQGEDGKNQLPAEYLRSRN